MPMTADLELAMAASLFMRPAVRPPAAILGGQAARGVMAGFARTLFQRGFRVDGVVQETLRDSQGRKSDMVLVDVITGQRESVSQHLGQGSQSCSLNEQAVCDVSGRLLGALDERPDLLVLSKFAHLEAEGRGFRAEFVAAATHNISVLTTVPPDSVEAWLAFTGGLGVLLPPTLEALWRWWGPVHVLADLAMSVPPEAGAVRQTVVGRHWIMIEGPQGWGMAPTPPYAAMAGDGLVAPPNGCSLAEVARGLTAASPWAAAWAVAALMAYHNAPLRAEAWADLCQPYTGLIDGTDPDQACSVVSALPMASQASFVSLPSAATVVTVPHMLAAAPWVLPAAAGVALPAAMLSERSLAAALSFIAPETSVVLAGVAAPLTPRVLPYGVSAVVGAVIHDPGGCAQAVQAGVCDERDLLPFMRLVVCSGALE